MSDLPISIDGSTLNNKYYDFRYFRNIQSNLFFVSIDDGESLINPMGKVLTSFSNEFYEEIFDTHPLKILSDLQEKYIFEKTKLTQFSEKEQRSKELDEIVVYKNFNISKRDLVRLKANEIVLLIAFRQNTYEIVNIDPKWVDTDRGFITLFCEMNIVSKLRKKNKKSTKYKIFIEGLDLVEGSVVEKNFGNKPYIKT